MAESFAIILEIYLLRQLYMLKPRMCNSIPSYFHRGVSLPSGGDVTGAPVVAVKGRKLNNDTVVFVRQVVISGPLYSACFARSYYLFTGFISWMCTQASCDYKRKHVFYR